MMTQPTCLVRYPASLSDIRESVVAVGNFDGVHLGHREVIERLLQRRTPSRPAVLVSFYPHPAVVLGKRREPLLLTSLREKVTLLSQEGLDYLYLVHFTERFSKMRAVDFIENVLFSKLHAAHLIVGADTAVGYRREGDVKFLASYCQERQIAFEIVPPLEVSGSRISSGRMRELLQAGDVDHATNLLGRPYGVSGRIVSGDQRGRKIGYPTANLSPTLQMLPRYGVYAVELNVEGQSFEAIAHVGVRPTFSGSSPTIETHILSDSEFSLYGKKAHISFLAFIREERSFESVSLLQEQIARDIKQVTAFFGSR